MFNQWCSWTFLDLQAPWSLAELVSVHSEIVSYLAHLMTIRKLEAHKDRKPIINIFCSQSLCETKTAWARRRSQFMEVIELHYLLHQTLSFTDSVFSIKTVRSFPLILLPNCYNKSVLDPGILCTCDHGVVTHMWPDTWYLCLNITHPASPPTYMCSPSCLEQSRHTNHL